MFSKFHASNYITSQFELHRFVLLSLRRSLLPGQTVAVEGGFVCSFNTCLVRPSRLLSPAELRQLNVSWRWSDLTWLSFLPPPAADFPLHDDVTLSGAWNDLVSMTRFSGQSSLMSSHTVQLVLRKSSVTALAVRSRFRLLRFLRLFVCDEISSPAAVCLVTAVRQSCLLSLPTTFHFSSAFCPTVCRLPFPELTKSSFLQVFLVSKGWLRCSTVFVFAAKVKQREIQRKYSLSDYRIDIQTECQS